jgi:hypothetical protein
VTLYDCAGGNHSFSEECCNQCFLDIEYGKIITDSYYCPECAPDDKAHALEFRFKRDVWRFQHTILEEQRWATGVPRDYLNDPNNWQRYVDEPDVLKTEWRAFMTKKWNEK